LMLIMLIMLAPSCYTTYVLPSTNFWRELKDHKVYLLFILSMAINGLGVSVWSGSAKWLVFNGWHPAEISLIHVTEAAILIVSLFAIFIVLHKESVWGPWAMRDFACFIPPGSLLFTLAFWELGHLHYRSWFLVVALTVARIIDVCRFAAFWTSILTTLANKWYALLGAFVGFAVVKAFETVSPLVVHYISVPWGVSPTWSRLVPHHPTQDLEAAQMAAVVSVWPLAIIAYVVQLMARRYFLEEVLTYKGHGNLMPDGTQGWEDSETAFVPASKLQAKGEGRPAESEDGHDGDTSDSDSSDEDNHR